MRRIYLLLGVLLCGALLDGAARAGLVEGDSPHGPLTLECSACHTTKGWHELKAQPAFDHAATAFPLAGRHAGVKCAACHRSLVFRDAGTRCVDCHLDIHRGQFANACAECHTPERWANEPEMIRRHQQTRFPLTGVHADIECQACHANGQFTGLATECAGCHTPVFQAAQNPNHVAAGFSKQCTNCHAVTRADWKGATFDHAQTGFMLTGRHTDAECAACHHAGYANTSTACYPCHTADFTRADDPDHETGSFDHNCGSCHTAFGWEPATFDHNLARFALTGAHTTLECSQCHTSGHYTGTASDCYTCHQTAFNTTTDPNHATGNFPHACTDCHGTTAWSPASFDHNLSSFPLTGAHAAVSCVDCHSGGQFTGTPQDCWSCHQTDFNTTTNPNHVTAAFSQACTECHTTTAWAPASFDHNTTAFPLTGAHVTVTCMDCHAGGVYPGTPTQCFACHESAFNGTTDPNHAAAQFPHTCETCHTTVAWEPSVFDHAATAFALTGAHTSVSCGQCHLNGQYAGTPTACYACHQSDYEGVSNPNHVTAQFDHTCTACHTTVAWEPASFDHSGTSFPLTGAHTAVNCSQCHVNGQFSGTPTDCWSCHQTDYNDADDPDHAAAQFPHSCQQCHSTSGWEPSSFNHANTGFALTGAHTTASCVSCHVNGQYAGTPAACFACHQSDFEGTTDPNHVAANFSHTCTECHTTAGWSGAGFDHSGTGFILNGAHTTLHCTQCHVNNQYAGTPTACYGCHQSDFEGVTDPNHVTAQFDHTCTVCHTTTAWSPASFDHNTAGFPLTGAHAATACNLCHVNGQYTGTPTDCWACHQSDYNSATDPNHAAAGFPQACASCHSTANWDATFNHDGPYFPIYSGRHQGEWNRCSDCHTTPGNFAVFSCIDCHEHNRADTDNQHEGEDGYVYQSSACYACHPRGSADDNSPSLPRPGTTR